MQPGSRCSHRQGPKLPGEPRGFGSFPVCSDLSWVSCLQTFGFLGVGETARGLKACCGALLTAKVSGQSKRGSTEQAARAGAPRVCF